MQRRRIDSEHGGYDDDDRGLRQNVRRGRRLHFGVYGKYLWLRVYTSSDCGGRRISLFRGAGGKTLEMHGHVIVSALSGDPGCRVYAKHVHRGGEMNHC